MFSSTLSLSVSLLTLLTTLLPFSTACDSCYGPTDLVTHERIVRRMQPDASGAASGPTRELEWGQINFLQTTDTHGWLEGHIKEQNYGADWGDFVSFTRHMKRKAQRLGVDLLLVDTGDLHDGAGLSDAALPNGLVSNPIFENIEYDILSIGNHELYVSDVAYETFANFSKYYGDRYVTSNVQIYNPATGVLEQAGAKYRYFTTEHGLRIMAYGVLFDFKGNSNASVITKASAMVQEQWFLDTLNFDKPIDMFLVVGHNAIRGSTSTLATVINAIRAVHPTKLIQTFGGHTHIRDFTVYDSAAVAMESGRYCETLGWVAVSGIKSDTYFGAELPAGVPHPTISASKKPSTGTSSIISSSIATSTGKASSTTSSSSSYKSTSSAHHGKPGQNGEGHHPQGNKKSGKSVATTKSSTASSAAPTPTATSSPGSPYRYARRYLDWNRLTFDFHAEGSQSNPFDLDKGLAVTSQITEDRKALNLTNLYGCAPATWCLSCKPFGDDGNIFTLLAKALAATVIQEERKDIPRFIIINTGSIRFDLVKGPFTYDDSFIVSPFNDAFQYIRDVPYSIASKVLAVLNGGAFQKRHAHPELSNASFQFPTRDNTEACIDPTLGHLSAAQKRSTRGIVRRQTTSLVPGYNTIDDFGSDGDDTPHSKIPYYSQPNDLQANASFPTGSTPETVDLVFLDYIGNYYVLPALTKLGANYTTADIEEYLPTEFTTNSYLPAYAKLEWQANVPDCPVGKGVGYDKRSA